MNSDRLFRHNHKRSVLKAVLIALTLQLTAGLLAADERGKQLYRNCTSCHGEEAQGNQLFDAPALAGLSEKYLVNQLKKFKQGHRGGNVKDTTGLQMRPLARVLITDEDREAVAKYIASLDPKTPPATIDDGDPEKGKMAYMICQSCHGAEGAGNDLLNAPSLLHQHDWYHLSQLKKFKEGVRGTHPQDITGAQMRPMSMTLADEQAMKDVIAYIQTLSE